MRIVGADSRRTKDRNCFLYRGECIEAVDEFSHDAQHAPRIRSGEVESRSGLLKKFFILGDWRRIANGVVDSPCYRRQLGRTLLRRRSPARFEMAFLSPLLQALECFLLGRRQYFGIEFLSAGGAAP